MRLAPEDASVAVSVVERNKAAIRALLDAADRGDMDAVAAGFAPDYHDHSRGGSRETPDRAGALAAFHELAPAFPDLRHTILDLIAEGDRVVLRVEASATHHAELSGITATGRMVSLTQTVIYRMQHGLIAERWIDGAESVVAQLNGAHAVCPGSSGPPDRRPRLLRANSAEWTDDASGGSYWELGLPDVSLTCFRLGPGARFPHHAHVAQQITLVLEGQLIFDIEQQRYTLEPGDAIAVPSGVVHAVESGNAPVLAIDAWSPPPEHLGPGGVP